MDLLLNVNWIALFVLALSLFLFVVLNYLAYKINWTCVVLLSLAMGAIVGIVFSTKDGAYLVWLSLLGDIYVNAMKCVVAPVILVSIMSGFIALNDKKKMRTIGVESVFWLLFSATGAIVLAMVVGLATGLGKTGGAVFEDIASVTEKEIDAYTGLSTSFDQVLLKMFPTNIVSELLNNNVVAIAIIAIAFSLACVAIASEKGQERIKPFVELVESVKDILYKIMAFIVDLTPFGVYCLVSKSASKMFLNRDAAVQMVLLVVLIWICCLVHAYGFNAILLKFFAKVSPIKYFKKISRTQATAFTTMSSLATLPVTIDNLENKVGVDEEVVNFTAPLGTTIGMPGCTCIWPLMLAIFYVNATHLGWGVGQWLILACLTLLLSVGCAGLPGMAVVVAIGVFSAAGLPVAAAILMMPVNNLCDTVRTITNVTTANVATTIVARRTGLLNDEIFNADTKEAN